MTPEQFRAIRLGLGLSAAQLARVLGFSQPGYILKFEQTNATARPVPPLVARLMRAYAAGYRPDDWPH